MPAKVDADEEKGRADDYELSMAQKEIEGHEWDALSMHFAGIKSFQGRPSIYGLGISLEIS